MIVTAAGMNVHPADVEGAMAKQAGVRACVVVPCELAGGVEPVAVVLFARGDAELQGAVEAANRGLAEYQKIRRVLRWPEAQFPYTSTGKLLRRKVKEWACAALSNVRAQTGAEEVDALVDLVAELTGEWVAFEAGSADRLRLTEDLHLDSLGRVQLQSLLEQRWGVGVGDNAMARVAALGDLKTLMNTGGAAAVESYEARPLGSPLVPVEVAEMEEQAYPRWTWSWPVKLLRVLFLEMIMRPLVWLLAAPKVLGAIAELKDVPVLIVANHLTAYDGALVLYALPWRLRHNVAAAMSGEMLMDLRCGRNQGNWLLNLLAPAGYWLLTALFNVFPLPRRNGFRRSFEHAGEAMDRGYSVLVFPEGTRSQDGTMHAFRPGIGLLVQMSRAPVLPVGLAGLGELIRSNARWFRSGRIGVRVGKPIAFDEAAEAGELTKRYENAVRVLVDGDV
jgi:long-chain acyl-CoA synthetase